MIAAVTDTHPLLWFASGQRERLGRKARRLFEGAEAADGSGLVLIPTVVLAECLFVVETGRVNIQPRFDHWIRELGRNDFFPTVELTPEVVIKASELPKITNPFDRLITATAIHLDYPVVTLDEQIVASNLVEVLWDD